MLVEHPTTVAVPIEHSITIIRRGHNNPVPGDKDHATLAFHSFVTLCLALLALPARLPAQEAAKKDAAPAAAATAAPAAAVPKRLRQPRKSSTTSRSRTTRAYGIMEKIALWVVLGIAIAG